MILRDEKLDLWVEECQFCDQQFKGRYEPVRLEDNPFLALCLHVSAAHPDQLFRCPRRDESVERYAEVVGSADFWRTLPNKDRVCSFCGSLHPDDFIRICDCAARDVPGYEVDHSDKSYKVYVRQPGVSNAGDGGLKFYKAHVVAEGEELTRQGEIFRKALERSNLRFAMRLKRPYANSEQPHGPV